MIPIDSEHALERYASVVVQTGLNVQPGQRLLISAPPAAAPLVRLVAAHAYRRGARLVETIYNDPRLVLARFQHAPRDSFGEATGWSTAAGLEYARRGDAVLTITGRDPALLAGQDMQLVGEMQQAAAERAAPYAEMASRNLMNWCVIAGPSPGWAARVFPDDPPDEQLARLWAAVLDACRLNEPDPVSAWERHAGELARRKTIMDERQYAALHFRSPDTDLIVGLPAGHRWLGGRQQAANGVSHILNLPTEEIYSLPDRRQTEGRVRSTRPLLYGDTLIPPFTLTFRDGRVVDVVADKGEALLRSLVAVDDGSAYLGEVALVPEDSPIARSGLLFHNTLFDENAACHLALGQGYRRALPAAENADQDAFQAAGGNVSAVHVDFMIGSREMDIDGLTAGGRREPVMRGGRWAFTVEA